MNERLISYAATSIQNYLKKRPNAADTTEGIHNYWVDWLGDPGLIVITEMALKQLERNGIVERVAIGKRELWRKKRE